MVNSQAAGNRLPGTTTSSSMGSLMRTDSAEGSTKPASSLVALCTVAVWTGVVVALGAAELKPQTIEAFDRYVRVTEARMQTELDGQSSFLWVDRLPDDEREEAYAKLRAGEVVIDRLETRDGDEKIKIPDGKIHHWIGTVLIPGVTLEQTMALVQDYDRYAEIYSPDVRQSKLLSRDGSRFRVYLQLFKKKVVTVVLNTEYDAEFVRLDDQRAYVPSYTTRIAEVEHPDTPDEREKPDGQDRGFMCVSTTTARMKNGPTTSTCSASRLRSLAGSRSF